ncbi:hypothetical protein ACFPZL_01145 [Leucobacter soli]|uniref:Uncharacterized protein n=1 Tax=Leucobacter soli TaxID=2812850 RepID=A0A916NPA3_9MICO|nr:hypothetical protein [Leucobacter soli]CAG7618427.1 hypothetical protein LEUCIP111803_02203 [Leucobacter soli]
MAASIRKQLQDALEPHLPGMKIIPAMRNVDVPDKPFAQLALTRLERLPAAPIGKHRATFVVTVVTPLSTPQRAEDDLDTLVGDLVYAIDGIDWLDWETAEKVTYGDRHLAYDVTVHAVTRKN